MTKETKVDKSSWGPGLWQNEPDRLEWKDAATGLPCLIVRSETSGGLCGYVAVPPGHPDHGKPYDAVDVDVHGGLTYSSACQGKVCHVPEAGEPDDVWWFGFNHAHGGDFCPKMPLLWGVPEDYKDVDYVRAGCANLASQIAGRTE